MALSFRYLSMLAEAAPPPPAPGGPPPGGGLGGGLPPPPPMGGGLGGGLGGLGGGGLGGPPLGGPGGAPGGDQQPVPTKTVDVMDVWSILKHTAKVMDKYEDLTLKHRPDKPKESPHRKSSLMS